MKKIRYVRTTNVAMLFSRFLRKGGDFNVWRKARTYNSPMLRILTPVLIGAALLTVCAFGQQFRSPKRSSTENIALPKASLWNHYRFSFQPSGENGPYHWRIVKGSLPHGLALQEDGELIGIVVDQGQFDLTVAEIDSAGKQRQRDYVLTTETPLSTSWLTHAQVSGMRIDGTVKVSNTTGRDFDLTFVVLAVNDIGRATAIGYQHFSLKANTRDQQLPFGDSLSPGNYAVNVDLVGEEPQSNMIFRSRLVSGKMAVSQGP